MRVLVSSHSLKLDVLSNILIFAALIGLMVSHYRFNLLCSLWVRLEIFLSIETFVFNFLWTSHWKDFGSFFVNWLFFFLYEFVGSVYVLKSACYNMCCKYLFPVCSKFGLLAYFVIKHSVIIQDWSSAFVKLVGSRSWIMV